jgi:hypothetical protein
MTAPVHAKTTSKGRTYQHPRTGETAWSVSTLIKGGTPNGALIGWASRSVAEYAVANHKRIGTMLESVRIQKDATNKYAGVISDPDAVSAAVSWLQGAPNRDRDRKSDLGSAVHAEVENIILGKPRKAEWDGDLAPFKPHWDQFVADFAPEFIASEVTVWNRAEKYAGTLDWIAKIGDKVVLGDVKTGKAIYAEIALQLCAYAHGEFVLLPDGSEEPLPAIDGAVGLHLRPDGYAVVPVYIGEEVWDAFRFVREVFRWTDVVSKNVLGNPINGPEAVNWLFAQTVEKEAA